MHRSLKTKPRFGCLVLRLAWKWILSILTTLRACKRHLLSSINHACRLTHHKDNNRTRHVVDLIFYAVD